jgi:long-chain acyl-CoA synthetase
MSISHQEAISQLTASGSPFETHRIQVGGVEVTAFKNAPGSLREVFNLSRSRGETVFLVYEDERWTFSETMNHVDAIAAMLVHKYGVKKGDRVAIAMRNYPEWVMSFAAILSIGAISVSFNAWWTEDENDFALEDCGAKVLLCDEERAERSTKSVARLGIHGVVCRSLKPLPTGFDHWEDSIMLGEAMPVVEISPDDDATILYTSGTTGRPKGAVSTHRSIIQALMAFSCRTTIQNLRYPKDAKDPNGPPSLVPAFILVVPLFHVTGCIPVMMSCFVGGLKLVIMYKWEPERALQLIEREQITNFVGVPTQSWDLLECPNFSKYDVSSLTNVGGGGAPAPPELVKRVATNFKKGQPGIGYGMTETNAYGPQNTGPDYISHPTSTGRGVPILEIETRNDDGQRLGPNEIGEIWFKGPHLIRGYWNRPEATAETIVDGWLRSGDLGKIDEEGFVYVLDRAKDMVLRAGENIYSAEVEASIYELAQIYECAVFGLPHERLGEEVACVIMLKPGVTLNADEVRAHVAKNLAGFKVPSRIAFVLEPLPRNASGKILKRELRDTFPSE